MNKKTFLLILIIPFILTGCYDYKELNKLAILSATEINKIDDEYIITAQVINPQAPDKTTNPQAPFMIYTSKGKTIQEAYRNVTESTPRYLYSNHLQVLIINEKIAKENVNDIIDFYLRNPYVRAEFYILIGKNDNILNIATPIDEISSTSIKNALETNSRFLGTTAKVTFNDFVNMSINPNLEVVIPTIESINYNQEENNTDNNKKTTIENKYNISGYALFKNNKLVGYLDNEQSKIYNFIKNKINNTVINYECEKDKYIAIEITSNKSKINIIDNNISISLNMKGNINECQCNLKLEDTNTINKLNQELEEKLNNDILTTINYIKDNYNTDSFGFLDYIYKYNNNYYKKIINTWYKDSYKNLPIKINTHINLIEKGNTMEATNEKN